MVNVVLLGATQGMGRALARAMAQRGDRLFLLGRSPSALEACTQELESIVQGAVLGTAPCDLRETASFEPALDAARAALGKLDVVVLTAGRFETQETLEGDLAQAEEILTVNYTHSVLFCEHARRRLLEQGGGTLCVFSSVAGERARKPVILYGSTKAGLSYYLEGLDHKYRSHGLVTLCVKPGFIRTAMTAQLDPPPFTGEPEQVARDVLRALDRRRPVVYTPGVWRWVMAVIRRLPRSIMRRVGF